MTELAVAGDYLAAGETDAVGDGREAWGRIKDGVKMMKEDWLKVGQALSIGRAENKSNKAFGQWCDAKGFGDIAANVRSDAIWLVENHESVLRLSQDEAFALNNPQLIRSAYRKVEKQERLAEAKEKFKAQDEAEDFDPPTIRKQDAFEFIDSFEDYSVDLLLTDPPYSTDVDDIEAFAKAWVPAAMSKVKATGRAYICIGAYPKELHSYLGVLLGLEGWIVDAPLIWTYRNALGQTPKHKYNLNYQVILHCYTELSNKLDTSITNEMFSVQDINAPDGRQGDRLHAWQKPDELANRLVRHSTKEGALVIDPFTCTGTFILAAARNGRVGIGSDINEENIEIGVSRGCRLQQGR